MLGQVIHSVGLLCNQVILLGLSFQILSIVILVNSLKVSDLEFRLLSVGNIVASGQSIFGAKKELSKAVLKRESDTFVSMITLFIGIVVQMFGMLVPQNISLGICCPILILVVTVSVSHLAGKKISN